MPRPALQTARIAALLLSLAFGIIGMGVGINALVKFHDEKRRLQRAVPAGATVAIDTNDILDAGYVVTVVNGLIALASFLFLLPLALAPAFAGRTLRFQGAILAFLTVWLFAALVPFTAFFANRSAQVSASLGSLQLPQSVIQSVIASLGATTVYRHVDYLRLPAILPWFTFLFAAIATALSFVGSSHARTATAYPVSSAGIDRENVSEKEKARVAQQDV